MQEDAAYPQSPPPPDSPPANKKGRVIIVAVRNSGRVRLHKARENSNGTFSVGKTWNLDELTRVESFSSPNPLTDEDVQYAQWAGDSGFIVTLVKPYYWQAGTAKEKEFFIGSLVKIYRKYTQGKVPELVGFSAKEIEQMLGVPGQRGLPSQSRLPPVEIGQSLESSQLSMSASPTPIASSPQSPELLRLSQGPPSRLPVSLDDRAPLQLRGSQLQPQNASSAYTAVSSNVGEPRRGSFQDRIMRQPASREPILSPPERDTRQPLGREQTRPMPSQPASTNPPQDFAAQPSGSEFVARRSNSSEVSNVSSRDPTLPSHQSQRRQGQPDVVSSERQIAPNAPGLSSSTVNLWKPNGALSGSKRDPSPRSLRPPTAQSMNSSVSSRNDESVDEPIRNALPERKRPPILGLENNSSQHSLGRESPSGGVSSMAIPPSRKAEIRSVSRSSNENSRPPVSDRMPGGFYPSPVPSESIEEDGVLPKAPVVIPAYKPDEAEEEPDSAPTLSDSVVSPPVRPSSPKDEEEYRPGLGPMVKNKSAKDVASTLRKAATAYNAFKPRAGGAGDKLRQLQTKTSNEPDGITGVIPAPSLARVDSDTTSAETAKSPTTEQPPAPPVETEEPPQLTVFSSLTPAPLQPRKPEEPPPRAPDSSPDPEESAAKLAEIEQARRNRRRSNQQAKYLSALGVDTTLLEGRGLDFESMLTDFGWRSSILRSKKIEVLEAGLRRELGRVEAGSWLGHLEQKDERVGAVGKMLDKAIAECDELDGLLTLYGVELSVGSRLAWLSHYQADLITEP